MQTAPRAQTNLLEILSPWADKPAGMFIYAFDALVGHRAFGVDNLVSDSDRIMGVKNFALITAYIAGAKECVTDTIKNTFIESEYAWGAHLISKKEIAELFEKGINMTEKEFDSSLKQELQLLMPSFAKLLLYAALCFSGCDGLNAPEIIRWLQVGRHMGVAENDMNNILVTYFHECSLTKAFEKNIIGESNPQSKL